MKTPKNKKVNVKDVEVSSSPALFPSKTDKPKKRTKKVIEKKNASIVNEVLEALGLATNLMVDGATTVKDLPEPNIEKASKKFGFAISAEDKIIDIANIIQKWYN